jgi:hypothetical protein
LHQRIGEADTFASEPGLIDERVNSLAYNRAEVRLAGAGVVFPMVLTPKPTLSLL